MFPAEGNEGTSAVDEQQPMKTLSAEIDSKTDEELSESEKQALIKKSQQLLSEFEERHQDEDHSVDIIQRPC